MGANPYIRSAGGKMLTAAAMQGGRDLYKYGTSYFKRPKTGTWVSRRGTNRNYGNSHVRFMQAGSQLSAMKRHLESLSVANYNSNFLYVMNCTAIPQTFQIDARERQAVFVRKLDICQWIRNDSTNNMGHRLIVVRVKNSSGALDQTGAEENLFRGNVTNRAINFSAVADGLHRLYYPINTDKYEVLHDEKFILGQSTDNANEKQKYIRRIVPVNKLVHFDNVNQDSAQDGIYIFRIWSDGSSNSTTPTLSGSTNFHVVTHFYDVL